MLIISAFGVWIYILINDSQVEVAPQQNTEFDSAPTVNNNEGTASDDNTRSVSLTEPLVQLTDRPVAGATYVEINKEIFVRYVERGTGHVFQISLATGEETRISGTTIPRVVDAVWSPSGTRVALTVEVEPYETETYIAHLTTNDSGTQILDGFTLDAHAHSLAFDKVGDTVFYAVSGTQSTVGYAENLKTGERSTMFEAPFTQIEVLWGDTIYIYNKPAMELRGFLYSVDGDVLTRLAGEQGLMAKQNEETLLISHSEHEQLQTRIYAPETASTTWLVTPGYPEKCGFGHSTERKQMWCSGPMLLPPGNHPNDWYQGAVSFDDHLWQIDLETGTSTFLYDPRDIAGRALDGTDVTVDQTDSYVLFTNKPDGTLWLYDLTAL